MISFIVGMFTGTFISVFILAIAKAGKDEY